ncbi:hypothetical protein PVAP13_2NG171106 [Panicum virgatum]|uniref:Uncharacterized protein n=1 Tax=Panicum virgatum TaxID=38727 RepID=A0A8T0VPB8_PANVG|nr:hypothetical protein PVAP13_2NG171106 [Panicum virgatum]
MTDYQKAGRNAKKRAKRTVNFFDPVANVASNEACRWNRWYWHELRMRLLRSS